MIEIEFKIDKYNNIFYYIKGTHIYHREDGPAIEYSNGTKEWYQNDKQHRLDGPAIEYDNGDKYWHQNDQIHRIDGPAIEYANGDKYWYLDGQRIDCQTQEQFEKLIKLKAFW